MLSDLSCIQLRMEIETNSIVSEEHINEAKKFGVDPSDAVDTKKYIIAFLKRLLLYREKIQKNLLEAHLNPVIATLWQEVLSCLKERNRKLVDVQSGSLVFKLFCPTDISLQQIHDEIWKIELQCKVDKLLDALGRYLIN